MDYINMSNKPGDLPGCTYQFEGDKYGIILGQAKGGFYKKSKAPAVLVAVGFGKEYDNNLAIRKGKSQRKNWKRWRNR
jgi:hypothetical protein